MADYSFLKRKRIEIGRILAAILSCSGLPGTSYADATDLIPPEYCGVVVASELSIPLLMASPNLSVYANHQVWVFGTNKGAFAAVVGITRKEGREGIFGELLESGFIMDDAFCSGGDKFWGLAAEPPDEPLPVFGELPGSEFTEIEPPIAVSPAWYDGQRLEWEATIGEWLNTTDDIRLRTTAYYINGSITSDDLLRAMIANGQFLDISMRTMECANQMSLFTLNTGQKSSGDRASDIVVVCAGMVN